MGLSTRRGAGQAGAERREAMDRHRAWCSNMGDGWVQSLRGEEKAPAASEELEWGVAEGDRVS